VILERTIKFLILLILFAVIFFLLYTLNVNSMVYHGGHPRLYFTSEDIPALQAKMHQAPTSSLWNSINFTAHKFDSFPASMDEEAYGSALIGLRYTGFVYALTGDVKVGNKGKQWLLQICQWQYWTTSDMANRPESGNYHLSTPSGLYAIGVGEAYDWLYPLLNESERQLVRNAIMEKAVIPAYKNYYYYSPFYETQARTNRAAIAYSGFGVAGLAILGDDPSNPTLTPYFEGLYNPMRDYLATYDSEGGWAEGLTYQSSGLCDGSGALYFLEALKNVKNEDLFTTPGFEDAYQFPLYMLPPDRRAATDGFNDALFNSGYSSAAIAKFASEYGNGYARWYYTHAPLSTSDEIAAFLWYDGSIPETDPSTLPESKLFPDIGWAALRSGWNTTDTLLSFRSGPVYPGHNRPEQNSFTLDALGERFIVEPGLSSKYYEDPNYTSYYRSTISQNTILINDNPTSQKDIKLDDKVMNNGKITDFMTTEYYDAVTGDATDAYNGTLSKFIRHIIFVKPDYVVLFDDLASAVGKVEFDSLLHTLGTDTIEIEDNMIVFKQNQSRLYIEVLNPINYTYKLRQGDPVIIDDDDTPTSFIDLSPANPSLTAQFLLILYPLPPGGTLPSITRLTDNTAIGVKITKDEINDYIIFNPEKSSISIEGMETDAEQVFVRLSEQYIEHCAIHNWTFLNYKGKQVVSNFHEY
jgi:hypothetical protein